MPKIKLPFSTAEEWRWRWMQIFNSTDDTLHRLQSFAAKEEDCGAGVIQAVTVCGLTFAAMTMPGMFSRGGFAKGTSGIQAEGAPRCGECCRQLKIPTGNGCPFNFKEELGLNPDEPSEIDSIV